MSMGPKLLALTKPLAFALLACLSLARAEAYEAAVVVDTHTGKILYADNPHKSVIPASLVKMMTALVALEQVDHGKVSLDDSVKISAAASRIGGHQVFLRQGEVFSLRELLKATIIGSANDAAYAVAEHVGGDATHFVELMNARAADLEMKETVFHNPHGLPPNRRKGQEENTTTAYDLSLLARAIIQYPIILKWSSTRVDSFRNGTFQLVNTNHRFLQNVEGADGLKTGYHPRGAGFSMVGTAVRNGHRIVTVVVGARSSRDRLKAASQLVEKGFSALQ